MSNHRLGRAAGFTFAELAFGLLILVISAVVLINHLAVNYQTTQSERDRVFAFSKAQAILSEIQNFVDRGTLEAVDLDVLDDGATNVTTLSIQTDTYGALVPADHVLSGNWQRDSQWMWSRRITVQPFAGADNRNVRYVTVRVYRRDTHGVERPLADLSAVINSAGQSFPTTQVYDVYLLAVENIPGWWVFMDSIRPFMESMITDLETRNPGLQLRTHWITKSSFGRNRLYRPYTNNVLDSNQLIPDVYNYPGRMPTGSASSFYYVPDNIKGRINLEGVDTNGYDSDLNPHPYALADFFNHAMRYPEELALWRNRVAAIEQREADIAAAVSGGTPPPPELGDMSKEPTLRLFLEDLNTNPDTYKNALVVNLHGELLPMPALRNYSDAAKSQATHPDLRVVTHPEELRTRRDEGGVTDPLKFRIYAYGYQTSASHYLTPPSGPSRSPTMVDPMIVDIVGVDLTDTTDPLRLTSSVILQNVPGGVAVSGVSDYSTSWLNAKHDTDTHATNEMYYRAVWIPPSGGVDGYTRLFLFNTPIGAPPVVTGGVTYGLAASKQARLYHMEYIPSPISLDASSVPQFSPDLTSGGTGPKNTARWRLSIDPAVLSANRFYNPDGTTYNPSADVVLAVRTRIASGWSSSSMAWESSGAVWPTPDDPDNLSVTYAYWADSKDDVPITERSQFLGDPRHLPYKDCFRGTTATVDYPNAYNRFLDNLTNGLEVATAAGNFTSIDSTMLSSNDCWGAGAMACDVPRFMQLLREGLVNSRCVYSSLTGWSYYYLGIGNDIGYDSANGYPSSIPTHLRPYGSPSSTGYLDTIIGSRRYVRASTAGTNYWFGLPWLGELVPDSVVASQWLDSSLGAPRGNLSSGTGTDEFYQSPCNTAYSGSSRLAYGTLIRNNGQRTSSYGCTTLFNIGSSTSTFQHSSSTANGTLTTKGTEIASRYGMSVPTSAPISRPFSLTASTSVAEHFNTAPYANTTTPAATNRFTASVYQSYYSHASGQGSAAVKLVNPAGSAAAYIVVNGISNAVTNGTPFIAQWNLLTILHTLLEAGNTSNSLRIEEQPRVEIESPTDITELINPATIPVQIGVSWTRWDGLPYAQTGTFGESEGSLEYAVLYSRDAGQTWLHVQDDSAATPGTRPDSAYLLADMGTGDEVYDWDVSAGFPEGAYQLRVECYRTGAACHYAYHQTRLFIQR